MRDRPTGCWNEVILSKPLVHPHTLRSKLTWGKKKFDFEKIIEIPPYISRTLMNGTTSWVTFREQNWGCKWNPEDHKINQRLEDDLLISEFWSSDVPIGVLLKLKIDDPDLQITGNSKTYLKDKSADHCHSWCCYDLGVLNEFTDEQLRVVRQRLYESWDEHRLNDLSLIYKYQIEKEIEPLATLEPFFN